MLRKVSTLFPKQKYSQTHLANTLSSFCEQLTINNQPATNYNLPEKIKAIFNNTQIKTRHFMFEPNRISNNYLSEDVMPEIIEGNVKLVSECITKTLSGSSIQAPQIDHIFCSSPVFAAPAISVRTMEHVPFRKNIKHSPMMGLGCVGGVALLSRATDYLKAYPKQAVMTVTAESGSRFWSGTLQHALRKLLAADQFDKEKVLQQVLAAALFGDAATCSLLVGADHPLYQAQRDFCPVIVDSESEVIPGTVNYVCHNAESSGIQSYLDHKLGAAAGVAMVKVVKDLLAKNNLTKDDVAYWFIHPGGPKILKKFQDEFKLSQQQMRHCWDTLADAGNLSSATVLRIYEATMSELVNTTSPPKPGSYGVMVAAGPGLLLEAILMKF